MSIQFRTTPLATGRIPGKPCSPARPAGSGTHFASSTLGETPEDFAPPPPARPRWAGLLALGAAATTLVGLAGCSSPSPVHPYCDQAPTTVTQGPEWEHFSGILDRVEGQLSMPRANYHLVASSGSSVACEADVYISSARLNSPDTAIIGTLFHEEGHIVLGHVKQLRDMAASTPTADRLAWQRQAELEADCNAGKQAERTGLPLDDVLTSMHQVLRQGVGGTTHPYLSDRMQTIEQCYRQADQ
ncbi:MAG: hypothetical protein AB7S38_08550 [Vulcanimicrobiota bacterium]